LVTVSNGKQENSDNPEREGQEYGLDEDDQEEGGHK